MMVQIYFKIKYTLNIIMNIKEFKIRDQTILSDNFDNIYIQISGKKIDIDRDLTIYTWSKLKNIPPQCDIIFDLSKFKIPVGNSTGLEECIQKLIQNHSA